MAHSFRVLITEPNFFVPSRYVACT